MNSKKELIFRMIIGGIIGLLAGLLIMNFIKDQKLNDLYEVIQQLSQNQNPPTF